MKDHLEELIEEVTPMVAHKALQGIVHGSLPIRPNSAYQRYQLLKRIIMAMDEVEVKLFALQIIAQLEKRLKDQPVKDPVAYGEELK